MTCLHDIIMHKTTYFTNNHSGFHRPSTRLPQHYQIIWHSCFQLVLVNAQLEQHTNSLHKFGSVLEILKRLG
jgi:hypothetical protein